MGATPRIGRRLFLTTGAGVLGFAVLGACSGGTDGDGKGGGPGSGSGSGGGSGGRSGSAAPSAEATGPLTWKPVIMPDVSAYLLVRGREAALVDTGNYDSAGDVETALKAAGLGWEGVRHVVLTHQHPDHVGGLASVEPHVPNARLHAGTADLAGIASSRPLVAAADGDEIFGLRVVATPGHTAGHISVFDPGTGVLVAGDALRDQNGLEGPDPQYSADEIAAKASVKKLAALSPKVILVGHGSPLEKDAAATLRQLASAG